MCFRALVWWAVRINTYKIEKVDTMFFISAQGRHGGSSSPRSPGGKREGGGGGAGVGGEGCGGKMGCHL